MTRRFSYNWPQHFSRTILNFTLVTLLSAMALAQKPAPVPSAPIPSQIMGAKKIFIANAGGDEMAEEDPVFTGGPDRAYNQFYAAMKNWGRYQIVGAPADADLLFEIRQEVSAIMASNNRGSANGPLFLLKIRDVKTGALLWGFNVHAQFGLTQGASDRNFDQAVERLVADVQRIAAPQPPASSANNQ